MKKDEPEKKYLRIGLRIDEDTHKLLLMAAKEMRRSKSDVIRLLIRSIKK